MKFSKTNEFTLLIKFILAVLRSPRLGFPNFRNRSCLLRTKLLPPCHVAIAQTFARLWHESASEIDSQRDASQAELFLEQLLHLAQVVVRERREGICEEGECGGS